jgi:hypothetical protein
MASRHRASALVILVVLVAGCGAASQSVEMVQEITVPVNREAVDAPRIQVTGRTEGLCGGEGGCVYFGTLSGPHSEGFGYEAGWEFELTPEGEIVVPDDIEMPLAVPGEHVIQLYAQQASDAIVNDERQLEAVVARCNARLSVDAREAAVELEVEFIFDEPGEGRCSIARHRAPMEPAFTFAPAPSD